MPNKNYQRGVRFERMIMEELSPNYVTMRTTGSHGVADVIAINEYSVRMIQAKTTADFSLNGYTKELKIFSSLRFSENVQKELWIKMDRKPVIKIWIM